MTQSGQGEEPSARPAREGIVLPSDGGEPLLPGMTTGPVAPGGGADGRNSGGGYPASAPPGGQTWGTPWGPEQQNPAPPPHGQDWQPQADGQWGAPEPSPWGAQHPPAPAPGPGPLPPEGAPAHGGPAPYDPNAGYGGHPGGAAPPGRYGSAAGAAPPPAAPYGAPAPGGYGAHLPPPVPDGAVAYPPPAAPDGSEGVTQYMPATAPDGSEGATQYMPATAPDGSEGATQYLPPVPPAGGDEGATQLIPPVSPGALPPEMPPAHGSGAAPYPGMSPQAPAAGSPDAEATQYIAPVTDQPAGQPYGAMPPGDGNRQPPAEFDSLFRSDDAGPAGSTQQLPRVDHGSPARAAHTPPPAQGGGRRAGRDSGGRGGGRTGSRVPLIAAVGVGIAVLGVGAGALMGNSGGDDDGGDNQTVSATAPASEEASPSPSADPVRQQAVALDKLLADSGDSRTTVINAVADVKACRELGQAAKDLRDAAGQRSRLVTDLSGLSVDKLPDHEALTAALTKAWEASASADNHYAAWADQTAGKKGCKKGQARTTGQTQAGNRASGTATAEKKKAADLWNAIARQYGLTERQPTQL
ncbi:hypothetical protein ACG2OD_21470 [Streptomyces sp. PDY-4]|uniref:Uncharacterized protein n=1 Tax=Streptomyces fungicidicus TaxID=68203 RepID=A0A494V1A4_9ACTN|nr:hypothetical protein [Streptomyces fungicidicus]AYL36644.1 hypothetical protein CNQ36_15145 [Streptomyces fungicidicus]